MTLRQLLVKPKDQDPKEKKSGVIYSYQCGEIACNEEYIEDPGREIQGTPKGTLSHPCAQPTMWSHLCTRQLQHPREEDQA